MSQKVKAVLWPSDSLDRSSVIGYYCVFVVAFVMAALRLIVGG